MMFAQFSRGALRSSVSAGASSRRSLSDVTITRTGKTILRSEGGRSSLGGHTATVFGATGQLGRYIVNRLARQGCTVVVPFREEMTKRHLKLTGDLGRVIFVEYDLRNTASIEASVRHSDVVYNLVGRDYPTKNFTLEDVHVEGTERIAEAVAKYDVDRYIHVSSHNANVDSPSEFFATKGRGELVARSIFPEATIVRPAPMFGFEDNLLLKLASVLNLFTANNMQEKFWPVHSIDVGAALEKLLYDDSTAGKTFELFGPKQYSLAEIAALVDKEIFKKRRHINVPKAILKPVAGLLNDALWWHTLSADEVEREFIDQVIDPEASTFSDLGIEPGDIANFTYHYLQGFRSSNYYDLPPATEKEKKEDKKYSRYPTLRRSTTVSSNSFDRRVFTSRAREGLKQFTTRADIRDHPAPRTASLDGSSIANHSAIPLPSRRPTRTSRRVDLRSGITYTTGAVILFAVVAISCFATVDLRGPLTTTIADPEDTPVTISFSGSMSDQIAPGHVGNLTPEQEEKLRQLWHSFFQLCGVVENNGSANTDVASARGKAEAAEADAQKKRRFGVFKKKGNEKSASSSDAAEEDKYGQNKHFQEVLANNSPEAIREAFWSMVKHDHPDALALRFLRARKWDVEKALVMLVSTMSWRHSDMKVDSDIMLNGEEEAITTARDGKGDAKKVAEDFLAQLRMGKSFLHGVDKQGRPICVVRVRLHRQGEQCEESLERYTVYLIETARMVLRLPVDTATIIFDMTGFSMANMDYTPVKFMIKCFEANYPESLGTVLVHNAPWIFQGIWKIIRGWLDPVVAAKVHFTNNKNDLQEFIEPNHILKELGGDENWEFKYVEPIAGENDLMKDVETKTNLLKGRGEIIKQYEEATVQWINNAEGNNKDTLAKRHNLAAQLKDDYWRLDPYLRARSLYDRQGILQGAAGANWYEPSATKTAAGNGSLETSINDLD
ncbi:hypothetical protein TARUN_6747 [Trichoderma arundinaceum]|uniref:CRAL-TRIO domain-containing protein n=1 Tax=Trichoderma arundinaceum TaxID=490622 RepID=A0A395NI90_TRIAR|nr:hypothetical protein TARUN_6747 [Trichoderma arundinaceum]